tara:strand:+ start:99919 stop:100146 length:228 start_codon:yes stop_codon:yes gene_type:complete
MVFFLTTFVACALSIVAAVLLLEAYQSRRKKNWMPKKACRVRDIGNGWKAFSLRIDFKEHRFISNGELITEIEQE